MYYLFLLFCVRMTSPRPVKAAPDAAAAQRHRKNRSLPHSPRSTHNSDAAAPPLPPEGQLADDTNAMIVTRGVTSLNPYQSCAV